MNVIDLEPYREAIRAQICSFCLDRRQGGNCGRPLSDPCALNSHLDILVKSVLEVGGADDVEPYIAAIRRNLCVNCREDVKGDCVLRDLTHCSLDSYHLPVIDLIEHVAEVKGHVGMDVGDLPACAVDE